MMKTTLLSLSLLTALILSTASVTAAVVQFDTQINNSGSPITLDDSSTEYNLGSLTVANNPGRMLVIAIGSGGNSFGDSIDISDITYGSQSFTERLVSGQGDDRWGGEIWTLASPTSGASQDVTLKLTAANENNTVSFAVMSFYNVDLSDPFLDTATDTDSPIDLTYDLGADSVNPTFVEFASSNDGSNFVAPSGLNTLISEDNGELTVTIGYQSVNDMSGEVTRSYTSGGPNNHAGAGLALQAIPEPSAGVLISLGLGILVLARRRSR